MSGSAAQPSLPHDELEATVKALLLAVDEHPTLGTVYTCQACSEGWGTQYPHYMDATIAEIRALILAQRQEAVKEALQRLKAARIDATTHWRGIDFVEGYNFANDDWENNIDKLLQTYLEREKQ